jgi:hypothetical protein
MCVLPCRRCDDPVAVLPATARDLDTMPMDQHTIWYPELVEQRA